MSAWGTAIFSDDLASDIRREYDILLSIGKKSSEIEEILIDYYSNILNSNNPDEDVFWYALALSEWKKGRLSDKVKTKALNALDRGKDLERWNVTGNQKKYEKRKKVLEEFRNTILRPMPTAKTIKKPTVIHSPWKEGSLLAYRIISNKKALENHPCFEKYVLLRVVKIERHPISKHFDTGYYNESILIALYNWMGSNIPNPDIVQELNYMPIIKGADIPLRKDIAPLFSQMNEQFAWFDWLPLKDAPNEITFLGCDENFKRAQPLFFTQPLHSRVFVHSLSFDVMLSKRFL